MPVSEPSVYTFPDDNALAGALRSYIYDAQIVSFTRRRRFNVAVSGDALPKVLATALLSHASANPDDEIEIHNWSIFFTDERAVPLDHSDSNYALLKRELLEKLPADKRPIIRTIDPAHLGDVQTLAYEYEQALVADFAKRDAVLLPKFDLVLLSCDHDSQACGLFRSHMLPNLSSSWISGDMDSYAWRLIDRVGWSLRSPLLEAKIAVVENGYSMDARQVLHINSGYLKRTTACI
ncbi:6-phosphogluconolactonase [Purpureocillium lilacinum]|uniref:6-phosphogluconolactonase n=1 Tax=Purpureocillium lilacinum TaxID=33203 RepID=A0A179FFM1_PURLI|nr:6-phosphogluconolactonase [Purpureocillium lilacinum]